MRLSYRGAHYRYEPTPVDQTDMGVTGHYRGQTVEFTYPRHIPTPQATVNLMYRGVPYRTTESGSPELIPTVRPDETPALKGVALERALMLEVQRQRKTEVEDMHRQAIKQRLQHRIQVAIAKGDTHLLRQLECELDQFF